MKILIKPYSAVLLTIVGFLFIGMALYFIFIRPPLLPEDLKYIGSTLQNVQENFPGSLYWLQKVFLVMGGFVFTTGVLIIYISLTSFRQRQPAAFMIAALTGITSIGLMTVVNFIIGSDFRWVLLIFTLPWLSALILYRLHK